MSHRSTPDLLIAFSAALGIVLGAIALLAATETVVAPIVALAALVVVVAAVVVLVTLVMADEGDDVESPAEPPVGAHLLGPVPLNWRRHQLPIRRAA